MLKNPKVFPLLGVALAAIFWVIDSAIDAFVFEVEHTFLESLLAPEPVELWMRCLVIVMLVLFSLFAKNAFSTQQKILHDLNQHKVHLERIVDDRTNELKTINSELLKEIGDRKKAEETLEKLATTDPLTTLFNRRKFDELLKYEMERNRRYRTGLSLIFCDIDHFKQLNDQHGHDIGDDVLRLFAQDLKNSIRSTDIIARWGGEEFMLLIPNTTTDIAKVLAEKLRKGVENMTFPIVGKITASFGVTHFLADDDPNTAIRRADTALYKAKENGRNRVEAL